MAFLSYSLLIVCIYICLGLGLTSLFCPNTLRRYIPLLAPLIGYSYLTLAGWYCYNLNLGGTDVYALYILGFPTLLLLFILLIKRAKLAKYLQSVFYDHDLLTACAISLLGLLIISLPLLSSDSSLNSISIGNVDPANYAVLSRYLKEFPRSEAIGFFAQQSGPIKWHIEESVFGAFLSTSFCASLLSLEVYQIQSMTIHIFFAFSITLVYVIARQVFQYNYWGASGVTILYALNPILYYTIYHGFQAQIIGTSVSLCVLLLNVEAIHNCERLSDYYKYIPFSVLLNWGFSLTYPHMLLLFYAPLVLYLAWYSLNKQSWRLFIYQSLFILVSLVIMSTLSIHRFQALLNYFFRMKDAEAGWSVTFIAPSELFTGFKDKNNFYEILVTVILSSLVIGLIYRGFTQARKANIRPFILGCSLALTSYAGCLVLSLLLLTSGAPLGGYKAYKLISFFLPQVLISCLLLFQNLPINFRLKEARFFTILCIVVFIGNYDLTAETIKTHGSVTQPLIDLQKIENDTSIKSINLLDEDAWQMAWQSYFLARKDLYFKNPEYYANPSGSSLNGEWNLINLDRAKNPGSKAVPNILKVKRFTPNPSTSKIINSSYRLEKANSSLWASFGKGWYNNEETLIWNGRESNSSEIKINSPSNNLSVDVKLLYSPLKPDDRLSVYLNQKKVADCLNNKFCQIQKLVLNNGNNNLEFKASLMPSPPGYWDARTLSYAFSSIEITPSKFNLGK